MKTLSLLLWVLCYVLLAPTYAHDWGGTLALVRQSVVKLSHENPAYPEHVGSCTGFVIGHIDNSAVVMTANHCLGPDQKVNGYGASIMLGHEGMDVGILRVPGFLRPTLRPNRSRLKAGHLVAAMGYGFGLSEPFAVMGHIAHPSIPFPNEPGQWFVMDEPFIGGMSGGPIVDYSGRVISIVQQTDPIHDVGYGRPINDLWELTRPFWDD